MPGHYEGPPRPPAPPALKQKTPPQKSAFDEQNTNDAAGKGLKGVGERPKNKELGVGWGP